MSHFDKEAKVHSHLSEQRGQELERRSLLISRIYELRGSSELPGEYPDEFIEELRRVPPNWQIDIFEEGIRFRRDFPYETYFYDMRGWDAARVVVNLDPQKNAVALRIALYDEEADVNIDEGVLVEGGKVVSFDQEMGGGFMYRRILRDLTREQEATKGESGCTFDHLKEELDGLPEMVRSLCGDSYGKFMASFLQRVESGQIDVSTMPPVALGWPLLSPYHAAIERGTD